MKKKETTSFHLSDKLSFYKLYVYMYMIYGGFDDISCKS